MEFEAQKLRRGGDGRTYGRMDGRLEIHPCVLHRPFGAAAQKALPNWISIFGLKPNKREDSFFYSISLFFDKVRKESEVEPADRTGSSLIPGISECCWYIDGKEEQTIIKRKLFIYASRSVHGASYFSSFGLTRDFGPPLLGQRVSICNSVNCSMASESMKNT